jgi:hypothetical protein
MRWGDLGGYDWQLLPAAQGGPTVLGLTFGYGLLDESIAEYGALRYFASALRSELARPVELATNTVGVPEVEINIQPDTVAVSVVGDRDTVVGAWQRLPAFFDGTFAIEPTEPHPTDEWGWTVDMFARAGKNSYSLSLLPQEPPRVGAEKIAQLRSHLDPRKGAVRCLFYTNDETLAVSFLSAPETDPRKTLPPATPRARGNSTGGLISATAGGALYFTGLLPRTTAGLAGALVMRTHFANALHTVSGREWPEVSCSPRGMGADLLFSINARPSVSADLLRRAVTVMLNEPVSDLLVDAVIDEVDALPIWSFQRDRRVQGLLDEPPLNREQVRQALAEATRTLHITDIGIGEIPGYPSLDRAVPDDKQQEFTGVLPEAQLNAAGLAHRVTIGNRTLRVPSEDAVVDLDNAVVRVDLAVGGGYVVWDDLCTGIPVDPRVYANGAELERRLEEKLAHVPRITPPDVGPDPVPELLSQKTNQKWRRWLGAGIALVVAVVVIVVTAMENSKPSLEPVQKRLTLGQTATLASGTTITVEAVDRAVTKDNEVTLTVGVRACAGENFDTEDDDAIAQRRIGPVNFQLWSGSGTAAMRVDDDRQQLQTITLPPGECTRGELIYQTRDPDDLRLGYENPFGDDVVWYFR